VIRKGPVAHDGSSSPSGLIQSRFAALLIS
jgi:hypothetical protein